MHNCPECSAKFPTPEGLGAHRRKIHLGQVRMQIGKRLRSLREARQMSQGDIEARTGLLRCYVSRVENGHTIPSLGTVENWAGALGVEVYQIFYQGDQPQAAKAASVEAFKSRERALLDDYNLIPWRERGMVAHLIRSLARNANGKGWRKGVRR